MTIKQDILLWGTAVRRFPFFDCVRRNNGCFRLQFSPSAFIMMN